MSYEGGTFLTRLAAADAEALLALGVTRRFGRGRTLFREGERSTWVGTVLAGRVKIVMGSTGGVETVLGLRGPGDLLGELSTVDGGARSATAVALEPVTVRVISSADFVEFLRRCPEAGERLLEVVVERLRDADRKRAEFGGYDALGRIAQRLIELDERYGNPDMAGSPISLAISQEELGAWTGSSREAVARALRTLRERRIVETGRRRITVLDRDALRRQVS